MRRHFQILIVAVILTACSSLKESKQALNSGDYEQAMRISLKKLRKDKNSKKHQDYIPILETAFKKMVKRDHARINFLERENITDNIEEIYETYQKIADWQEKIQPLLPLEGANFSFKDYSQEIINSKRKLAAYLYEKANAAFYRNNKQDYRKAYELYQKTTTLFPNYKDCKQQMELAHYKGIDFVLVRIKNQTNKVLPRRLEKDLLDFNSYKLDNFWTIYDGKEDKKIFYDFELQLRLVDIKITPDHVFEREIIKEKQVKDGYTYVKDTNGNFVTDSLGNKIKQDRYVTAKCVVYQTNQHKECHMAGKVEFIDLQTGKLFEHFPLNSSFVFDNNYGDFEGDKDALDESTLDIVGGRRLRFPSNEQMIYDTGQDLKKKLRKIIQRQDFSR